MSQLVRPKVRQRHGTTSARSHQLSVGSHQSSVISPDLRVAPVWFDCVSEVWSFVRSRTVPVAMMKDGTAGMVRSFTWRRQGTTPRGAENEKITKRTQIAPLPNKPKSRRCQTNSITKRTQIAPLPIEANYQTNPNRVCRFSTRRGTCRFCHSLRLCVSSFVSLRETPHVRQQLARTRPTSQLSRGIDPAYDEGRSVILSITGAQAS